MTTNTARGAYRGSEATGLTVKWRQRGTSLVEILVVIVIFLIGILAVVQIFPKGFQLLLTTRNNSVATALGRDAVERLKSNPDSIPDQVLPVRYVSGVPVVDSTINPLDLTPLGDSIAPDGSLAKGGATVANDWMLASGPNVARRIVGEGARVPSPREEGSVGTGAQEFESYGGLMVLAHGPIDPNTPLVAYGNELSRTVGTARDTTTDGPFAVEARKPDGTAITTGNPSPGFNGQLASTAITFAPYEFFVENPSSPSAAIVVPATRDFSRTYRVRLSAYVGDGTGYHRVDYLSLSVLVPALADTVPTSPPALIRIPLYDLLLHSGVIGSGVTLSNVAADTVRVAPQYVPVMTWTCPANLPSTSKEYVAGLYTPINPFEMKIVDPTIGVLLFSPAASKGEVSRPGGVSEPLVAKVDYDVLDWRIIGEDFRVVNDAATYSLDLQSLKVGTSNGADGRPNGGMFDKIAAGNLASSVAQSLPAYDPPSTPRDNVVVIDLTTGFEVQRYMTDNQAGSRTMADVAGLSDPAKALMSVDKSRGSITFRDADPNTKGLQVRLIPPSGNPILVDSANRTFRVLYRARNEWSVQVMKGASQYSVVQDFNVGPGQCLVGNGDSGTLKTRIYFPKSDAGHKITVDRIVYAYVNGTVQTVEGQDFVVKAAKPTDAVSLSYADLTDVDSAADHFVFVRDPNDNPPTQLVDPVTGVKGASVDVRVLWNPDALSLSASSDPSVNLSRVNQWMRGWRKSTTETYLRNEETR